MALCGMDDDFRIDQAGGTDDLLDDFAAGFFEFVFAGCRGDVDDLVPHRLEFLEFQRAIVERAGKTEAVIDQDRLTRAVAVVHRVDLWKRYVRFVDDEQEIPGEIVEQRVWFFAGFAAVEVTAVVFDAAAIADLEDHFDVVLGSGQQALRF